MFGETVMTKDIWVIICFIGIPTIGVTICYIVTEVCNCIKYKSSNNSNTGGKDGEGGSNDDIQ